MLKELKQSDPQQRLQRWMFLFIWPLVNVAFVTGVLFYFDVVTLALLLSYSAKAWASFLSAFVIISLCEQYVLKRHKSGHQIAKIIGFRISVIFAVHFASGPMVDFTALTGLPRVALFSLFVLALECTIYAAITYILHQQAHFFASQIQMQQTELNALRTQTSPHFLFNTLNLIASEISRRPDIAKELVFDLSDLLRKTLKLAETNRVPLKDELEIISLYLSIQESRFRDRFTFNIDCPDELSQLYIPSLLLLPLVENAIKHGVAPYAQVAHVSVVIRLMNESVAIEISDTGKPFDMNAISTGDGLRIVRQTLDIYFNNQYQLALLSTPQGGLTKLSFPQKWGGQSKE